MSEDRAKTRPSFDEYFLRIAKLTATRGTCRRRRVGCVLTDDQNVSIATGYNGAFRGARHCIDTPCAGADAASGTSLDLCEAIHAEQNALLRCSNIRAIKTCYTTASPCITCVKLLLNTSCERIVFEEEYPHSDARLLWASAVPPREWIKLTLEPTVEERIRAAVYGPGGSSSIMGYYRHYKTPDAERKKGLYEVIGVTEDGDTHKMLVQYIPPEHYGFKTCTRDYTNFTEQVTTGYDDANRPVRVPRFKKVSL